MNPAEVQIGIKWFAESARRANAREPPLSWAGKVVMGAAAASVGAAHLGEKLD